MRKRNSRISEASRLVVDLLDCQLERRDFVAQLLYDTRSKTSLKGSRSRGNDAPPAKLASRLIRYLKLVHLLLDLLLAEIGRADPLGAG